MVQPPPNYRLSESIAQTLGNLRSLLRRYIAAQGLLAVVLWLLLVFWVGGLIDYLPVTLGSNETPRWLRIGLLVTMSAGCIWILVRWIFARLWVRPSDSSLAVLIERHYPQLNNELITAVECSRQIETGTSNPTAYRDMLVRVHQSASERVAVVQPAELFNWQPLWAVGIATAFGLVVTAVAAIGMSDWTGRWARRLFTLSNESWPRKAALRADGLMLQIPTFSSQLSAERILIPFVDGIARIPLGAAPMLQISADANARQIPEVCTMFYRANDGARGRANLRRVGSPRDQWQAFTLDGPPLDGLSHDMQVDIVGLDARLRDLTIQVVQPAAITEMKLDCSYPSYLLDSLSVRGAQELLPYRNGISIPEGTQVSLVGAANQPLTRVEYLIHSSASDEANSAAIRSVLPQGNAFRVDLGTVASSQVIEIRLVDQFGLSSEQVPRYVVSVQADTPPEVSTQLDGIGLAITPNAQLPIVGSVEDDHGVKAVTAELVVNDSTPLQVPLELQQTKLQSLLDLEKLKATQSLALEAGATLGFVVIAQDYYDLSPQPHLGRGQPIQLSVVTPDQLLVILDRQELELRQRLELIVSELEQLQDVLQTLKTDLPGNSSAKLGDAARFDRSSQASPADSLALVAPQNGKRESPTEIAQRLAGLWAQQSVLQADKSQQELSSVAARVDNLRLQLVNNRIDSFDRQERLLLLVGTPLRELLALEYEELNRRLAALQTSTLSGGGAEQASAAAEALAAVLRKLEEIKANMQDIEDFNEIIDLVRGLLDDQEKVLNETEQEQRKRILELLR